MTLVYRKIAFILQLISQVRNKQNYSIMSKKFKILLLSIIVSFLACGCSTIGKKQEVSKQEVTNEEVAQAKQFETVDEQQAADMNNQQDQQQEEIEVPDRILFGYDSSEVDMESRKILDVQVAWLNSDKSIKITIEGHTDERGTREYNISLGEKRANAAKSYLTARGIDASRIKVVSYGKERPAFVGGSEDAMAKNRRAVVVIN